MVAVAHPTPTAPRQESPPQEVRLKVSVDQVRVDVVVTDKRGRAVPGLRAEDFEVYQDGELQQITNLVFIENTQQGEAARPIRSGPEPIADIPVPHVPLERHQVKRAFVLVVDDLGLSFESLARTRHILIKFIREQIQPGDLVALARTSQAVGALQQFTSDKRQLEAAAKRLRFSFRRFGGNSELQPAHTLFSLLYIINGLKDLPGRKSVIFLSDGLSLYAQNLTVNLTSTGAGGTETAPGLGGAQGSSRRVLRDAPSTSQRVVSALQRVVDAATRAFVSVYAIDARGLVAGGFSAADDLSNLSGTGFSNRLSQRSLDLFDSQSGLAHLARQTGGLFYRNNNNLRRGIERALEDQRAYYLLSYQPPPDHESKSRKKKPLFHRIQIKVKPAGLRVRHRAGFLDLPDSVDLLPDVLDPSDKRSVRRRALLKVLSSPFAEGQLEVRLSSLYFNDSEDGAMLRVLAHVEGKALGFQEEGEGKEKWHTAPVDVLIALSDLDGRVVAADYHTFVLSARGRSYQRLQDEGVIFPRTLSVEKHGGYHLRVAVIDQVSGRGGSAAHFVEIP
ncbi:MAG: VWA domain-containing protein, partial [Acidobacteriota bacterium]